MKRLKSVCLIIGIAVIAGGILYFLLKMRSGNKGDSVPEEEEDFSKKDKIGTEQRRSDQDELNRVKGEVGNDIRNRHEEIKTTIRESVNDIFSDTAPDQTRNSEKLRKMQEDLEKQ